MHRGDCLAALCQEVRVRVKLRVKLRVRVQVRVKG